jgi:hypothetical protein
MTPFRSLGSRKACAELSEDGIVEIQVPVKDSYRPGDCNPEGSPNDIP